MPIQLNDLIAEAEVGPKLGTILPSQFFDVRRNHGPEQRLMMAVLKNALQSIEKYRFAANHRDRKLFRDAEQWLLAEEPDWPYSFECICGVLDLDSNAVRQHLRVVA